MQEVKNYSKRILTGILLVNGIISFFLYTFFSSSWAMGFLIGTVGSLAYVVLLFLNIMRMSTLQPHQVVQYMKRTSVYRLAIVVVVLIAAMSVPNASLVAAGCGMLGYRLVMIVDGIFAKSSMTNPCD